MSNNVFPTLPGLTFGITRAPIFSTTKRSSVSLREFRTQNASYPLYRFKLTYEMLRQGFSYAEMSTLAGFFTARGGNFDSFLFTDPDDNNVTAQSIGLGDASNKVFQLIRAFGGYNEPVFDVNGVASIFLNGVLKTLTTDYTISASGVVTFVTAPGAGVAVTWTGSYYRRVTFEQDIAEFSKFMQGLWELKSLTLKTAKP